MSKKNYNAQNATYKIVVKANSEEWVKELAKAETYLKSQQTVPGFRKGKVPAHMLRPVSIGDLRNRALNKIFPKLEAQAIEAVNKDEKVISRPELDITKIDDKELELTFIYPVMPHRVELDLSKLNHKLQKKVITEDDVETLILDSLVKFAIWKDSKTEVTNRSKLNISFTGKIDGKEFDGGSVEDLDFELGNNNFLPDFEKQLIGMKAKGKKSVSLTMPKDYYREELSGKKAIFDVVVNSVQEREYPLIDDQFVASLNSPAFKTADELRSFYKNRAISTAIVNAKDKVVNDAINELVETNEIPVPTSMLKFELENVNRLFDQKLATNEFTREEYIESTDYTTEKLNDELTKEASKNVQKRLVNDWLIEQFGIKIEPNDIETYFAELAKKYNMEDNIEALKQSQNPRQVADMIVTEKFFDAFLEILDSKGYALLKEEKLITYK